MKQRALICILTLAATAASFAQRHSSPPAEAMININGKTIDIKYSAPSVHGRKIFGGTDALHPDNTVWRAGANQATSLHTDAELNLGGLDVPPGNYTLFIFLQPNQWQLIVNRQTGQSGLEYHKSQDLSRAPMTMSKPPALVETLKYTLTQTGPNQGMLTLQWENVSASVPFTLK